MSNLPPIIPPDDFENVVYIRSLLSSMPSVQPPEKFEEAVQQSVHRPSFTLRNGTVLVVVLGLLSGLVYWVSIAHDVVAPIPAAPMPTLQVNTPPLPIAPSKTNPDSSSKKRVWSKPKGVTGY